jgi:hypothetical protein
MTALWVACPAVEGERDTVNVSTEIKIKIFSLRFSFSRGRRCGLQTPKPRGLFEKHRAADPAPSVQILHLCFWAAIGGLPFSGPNSASSASTSAMRQLVTREANERASCCFHLSCPQGAGECEGP